MDWDELRINGDRLKNAFEAMAKIGGTAQGGVHRLALSDEDRQARNLFLSWLAELRLEIIIDEMGNIFARRAGRRENLPPVMAGSHIDSQPHGGRFDGLLGVMAALEALRTLQERRIETERSIVIVDWTNEEGSRFPPAMTGSGFWSGNLQKEWIYEQADAEGKKLGRELKRIGFLGDRPGPQPPLQAYFELHIEQGPVLEREGKIIGVPEGIVGLHWYDVSVEGMSNQVGPTPMEGRKDALCAAAEMVLKVNHLPEKMGGNMVATVGEIHNFPNSRNIIPGRVRFTVDLRSWDDALARRAWEELQEELNHVAGARGCLVKCDRVWEIDHTPFDENLRTTIWDICANLGYSRHSMVSGAGHDASYVGGVAPTAMIFVPSIAGRSHVEAEKTDWTHCEAGANVLLHCLLKTANSQR